MKDALEADGLLSWIIIIGVFFLIYVLTCLRLDLAEAFTVVTAFSGAVVLLDKLRRQCMGRVEVPAFVQICASVFPVMLTVLVLRVAIFEHFRIPSGSMKPTLLEGDVIMVNKSAYGVRLPFSHHLILKRGIPQRGDLVVFHHPQKPGTTLVKRVVGVPGDKIAYRDKMLYIDGVPQSQTLQSADVNTQPNGRQWRVRRLMENLGGHTHAIFLYPGEGAPFDEIEVPEKHYFMMGDNRDDSQDSRVWGPVPESDLLGPAFFILLSWDAVQKDFRWSRMGFIKEVGN